MKHKELAPIDDVLDLGIAIVLSRSFVASRQPLNHRRFPAEGSDSRNDHLLQLHLRRSFSHVVVTVHGDVVPDDTIQHRAGVNLVKA